MERKAIVLNIIFAVLLSFTMITKADAQGIGFSVGFTSAGKSTGKIICNDIFPHNLGAYIVAYTDNKSYKRDDGQTGLVKSFETGFCFGPTYRIDDDFHVYAAIGQYTITEGFQTSKRNYVESTFITWEIGFNRLIYCQKAFSFNIDFSYNSKASFNSSVSVLFHPFS